MPPQISKPIEQAPPRTPANKTDVAAHDYEFEFGKDRRLKGSGLRGLVALALLLIAFVVVSGMVGQPLLTNFGAAISRLISASKLLW
jgi:hypothetical protein